MSNRNARQNSESSDKGFKGVAENIGLVAAPLTVITALMFWIGWIRTDAVFAHFGLHSRLVELSNQDYIQRSVDGLFDPLAALIGATLLGYWVNVAVRDRLVRGRRRRIVIGLTATALLFGSVAFVSGLFTLSAPDNPPTLAALLSPLLLGVGLVLLVYGQWLLRCARRMRSDQFRPVPWSKVELTLVSLLVVLCAFWAATGYARAVGRGEAERFAAEISQNPGVVLYTDQRLFLIGPDVHEETLPQQPPSQFHYRYSGLRLFSESKDRLFLVPATWSTGATTFMVPTGPGLRVDFLPGPGA